MTGYMDWNQLLDLHRHGYSIQSHTLTHPMLGECTDDQIFYELNESKETIERKIGNKVNYLSLPFGSYNENVIKYAKKIGYLGIFTSSLKKNYITNQFYQCGRIPIKDSHQIHIFIKLINNKSMLYRKTKFVNSIKSYIKNVIGLNNYRKIYRLVNRIKL